MSVVWALVADQHYCPPSPLYVAHQVVAGDPFNSDPEDPDLMGPDVSELRRGYQSPGT